MSKCARALTSLSSPASFRPNQIRRNTSLSIAVFIITAIIPHGLFNPPNSVTETDLLLKVALGLRGFVLRRLTITMVLKPEGQKYLKYLKNCKN
jgi:hypothetical protein